MDQQLKHFLITRFNLKNEQWTQQNVLSEDWLEKRIELFEKVCFPSVINQSNQHFIWLIFFDIDTPQTIKNYVEENYTSDLIQIHYIDGFKELESSCRSIVSSQIEHDSFYITSRLDNDDALHKEYIETIKNLSIPQSKTVIDIVRGYQLYHQNKGCRAKSYSSKFNPFISLISNANDLELIIDKQHLDWNTKEYHCISYYDKKLWLQYIHDNNQLNTLISSLPTISMELKDFSIEKIQLAKTNTKDQFVNLLYWPARSYFYLKNDLRMYLKKK